MNSDCTSSRSLTLLAGLFISLFPTLLFGQVKITSFSPITGKVGVPVTIAGTGFDPVAGNNIVYFGATRGTVTAATATQIIVTVPPGSTYQPISVTTGGLTAYSARPFVSTFGCVPVAFDPGTLSNKVNFSAGFFSSPISAAVADLDMDGKPDIVVTNQDNNSISVFRNTSSYNLLNSSSFAPAVNFGTEDGPVGIAISDLNGDGKPDIAVTNNLRSTISVFRNTSITGTIDAFSFAPQVSFMTSTASTDSAGTSNICIADLDGDGRPDMTVTNGNKNTISLFRNTSTGGLINSESFAAKVDLSNGILNVTPVGLVVTDLNGDGKVDIVVNNAYGGNLSVFRNTSSVGTINGSSFASRTTSATELGTSSVSAGDLNNDGAPDLVITNTFDNSISVFQNTSSGTISFAGRVNFAAPTNPVNAIISDINGDGNPDIAVNSWDANGSSSDNNPISLYANISGSIINNASFNTRVDFITGGSSGRIGIADFDNDGKPDFAVPNYTSDLVSVLKNNASIFNALPTATINGLNAFCDDNTWKHFYDPFNTSRIICSIKDNGNNLGATNARVYVDAAPPSYRSTYLMQRHYVIKPANQPLSAIQVRLYFTTAEFNALKVLDNSLSAPDNLTIAKYDGPTEDGVFNPDDASSFNIIPSSSIIFGTAFGGYYADFTVNSLSEFWFNSAALALPIDLLYFRVEKQHDAVLLQWSTASETHNDFFTIQRGTDGINFSAIGNVKAGTLSIRPLVYELKDPAPLNGINYYRLKQTDKDGKSSFSAIKTVDWDVQNTLRVKIAPQPMKTRATVGFYSGAGKGNLIIYNAQGGAVQTCDFNRTTNGNVQLNIQKNRLAAGMYFYKIFNNNQQLYQGKLILE